MLGKVVLFKTDRGYGFIKPDDGGKDVFFSESVLREGDSISPGVAVIFEIGADPKSETGKPRATSVDLA